MDASLWNQLFLEAMEQDATAKRIHRSWIECGVSPALVSATLYLYFNAVSQKELKGSLQPRNDALALSKNMASLALDLGAFTKTEIGRFMGHQIVDVIAKLNPLFPVSGRVNPGELDINRLHEDLTRLSKLLIVLAKPLDVSVPRKEFASRALVWLYLHVQILEKRSENKTAAEVIELLDCARSVTGEEDYFGNSDAVRNRVKRFKADHKLEFDLIESLLKKCGPPDTFSELTYAIFQLPSLLRIRTIGATKLTS